MSDTSSPVAPSSATPVPDSANSAPTTANAVSSSDAGRPAASPRAPKLAPAPVPVETPWKAPVVDSTPLRPQLEAELTKPAKKAGADDSSAQTSKRSTTGKEKWVPYAPVVPISSAPAQNRRQKRHNHSNGASNTSNQNASSFRQRRHNHGNADRAVSQEKDNKDNKDPKDRHDVRRKPNSGTSARSAGHHRAQSRAETGAKTSPETSLETSLEASTETGTPLSSEGTEKRETGEENGAKNAKSADVVPPVDTLHLDRPRWAKSRPNSYKRKDKFTRAQFYGYAGAQPAYGMVPVPVDYRYAAEYVFPALVNQVNHYFSVDNLYRDMFLRGHMNDEGLVPIAVISVFNRVKMLTTDWQLLYQACLKAPNIEVVGTKVRAAHDWERWLLPEAQRSATGRESGEEPAQDLKTAAQQAVPFVPRQ